jgi:hypothetical protein
MSTTKLSSEILEKLIVKSQQPAQESGASQPQGGAEPIPSDTSAPGSLPSIEMLNLGVAGGAIPDTPAEAYRAGFLAGQNAQPAASRADLCWNCGKNPQAPLHAEQVTRLRQIHYARTPIFHWPAEEFERLVEILDEMGGGAHLDGIRPFGAIFYSSVRVVRGDGSVVDLSRDDLRNHGKDNGYASSKAT